jgi:argininosuccinate lyase
MNKTVAVQLTPDDLRYLISCGVALVQNLSEVSLPTYCHFNKAQIIEFSACMCARLNKAGYDM